jgi:hypothetical protein
MHDAGLSERSKEDGGTSRPRSRHLTDTRHTGLPRRPVRPVTDPRRGRQSKEQGFSGDGLIGAERVDVLDCRGQRVALPGATIVKGCRSDGRDSEIKH